MTFKSVFRSLQEIFPQIDLRVLKPVAIEYREDADAAVEFIFSEVLPSLDVQKEDSLSSDFHLQNSLKSLKVHPSNPVPSAILGRDEATFIKDAESGDLINGSSNVTSSNLHGEDPVAREAANEVNGYPWEVDDVEQSCCPRSSQVVSVEYLEELVNSCKVTKHADEVYDDKTILATEAKELQSQIHSLAE